MLAFFKQSTKLKHPLARFQSLHTIASAVYLFICSVVETFEPSLCCSSMVLAPLLLMHLQFVIDAQLFSLEVSFASFCRRWWYFCHSSNAPKWWQSLQSAAPLPLSFPFWGLLQSMFSLPFDHTFLSKIQKFLQVLLGWIQKAARVESPVCGNATWESYSPASKLR